MSGTDGLKAQMWTCSQCGRRVPRQITTCRCGRRREEGNYHQPAPTGFGHAPRRHGSRFTFGHMGWVAAVLLLAFVAFQHFRSPDGSTSETPVTKATETIAAEPDYALETHQEPVEREETILEPPRAQVVDSNHATATATTSAPSLEDIVGQTVPAVVSIESETGRIGNSYGKCQPRTSISAALACSYAAPTGDDTTIGVSETTRKGGGQRVKVACCLLRHTGSLE